MVKESERKRPYRPRAPHKEGCECGVCKSHLKVETVAPPFFQGPLVITPASPPPPPPTRVRIDSLAPTMQFTSEGVKYQVNEKIEGMIVCYNFLTNATETLGGSTMVEPIK